MEHMINEILKYGGKRRNLEIKLFGGGKIMSHVANIGQQNIDFIKAYVKTESLTLLAEDLGGVYPRKILFYPKTGRVRVKKLRSMEQIVVQREKVYQRDLEKQPIDGEIDLF
jgi:chemotaxis protein CheD